MFRGKKYKESAKQIDKTMLYDAADGMALICKTASAKFDETVELHVKLGVDSRHADQQVRGAIVLPHGTGKTQRVLVFAGKSHSTFTCFPKKTVIASTSIGLAITRISSCM